VLNAPGGDRCTACQAPLASDQRYCVNCGERRGKARFSFASMFAPPAPAPAPAPPRKRRARVSSGATLVAGVATLLLAMGVGVLIGNTNNANSNPPARASAPVQVITVGGAAASPTAGVAGTQAGTRSSRHGKPVKAAKVHLTTKVVQAAAASAAKVLGGGAPKQPTVTTGQQCVQGQQGCTNGKFTGQFFGGP
jgi:hypothetical protein